MDLLRLVIAHQRIAKLETLPRLLNSPIFAKVWREKWNVPPMFQYSSIMRDATMCCDIPMENCLYMGTEHLIFRAIFLRDSSLYQRLARPWTQGIEFWYALESGIPEIQAWAIVLMSESCTNSFYDFGDVGSVPWTLELREQMSRLLVHRVPSEDHKRSHQMILGAIGKPAAQITEEYVVETIRRLLDYKPSLKMNNSVEKFLAMVRKKSPDLDIDVLIILGDYYFPLLARLRCVDTRIDIFKLAFSAFAYPLLHHIVHTLKFRVKVDCDNVRSLIIRRDVVWIRACLDDPEIRGCMKGFILDSYRILSGEIMPGNETIRRGVANPGLEASNLATIPSSHATQGRVIFTTHWNQDYTDSLILYARGNPGQGNAGINYTRSEQVFADPDLMGKREQRYKQILRELTS